MSLWVEQKYVHLLSYKLDKFKKRGTNTFSFRCVYCGDSQKNKNKTRGYLYEVKNSFHFHCHNCGTSQSFSFFLKSLDYNLYNQFLLDQLQEKGIDVTPKEKLAEEKKFEIDLKTIASLPINHHAKKYLINRKIPVKFFSELYYSDKYMAWINSIIRNKFSLAALKHDAPRIVIPFKDLSGELFAVQGRALDPKDSIRYSTAIFKEVNHRFYGLDRINFNKKYYVVEGPFDSMFVDNCIAAGSSDLDSSFKRLGLSLANAVFIIDNQPRNEQIVKIVKKYVDKGYNVVIWPEYVQFKDLNEAIKDYGYTQSEIQSLIENRTYQGLEAQVKFNEWSKI